MTVPDFQSVMLPMLRLAGDGAEHVLAQTRQELATVLEVSEEGLAERLPSGTQTRRANRVAWAKVHLDRAGLVRSTSRGVFIITDRGRQVLASPPEKITVAFLNQFDGFAEFRAGKSAGPSAETVDRTSGETPEEAPERAHAELDAHLAAEIIERVMSGTSRFFEELVVELVRKMGYGGFREDAGQVVGRGGDEGIDGIVNEDLLGLDVIYLQAKRWKGSIGRPEIQKFVGALHGQRARKGIFITTSYFTPDAQQYVEHIEAKVVLINGQQLAAYMIRFNLGVTTAKTYAIKQIDSDYFGEE